MRQSHPDRRLARGGCLGRQPHPAHLAAPCRPRAQCSGCSHVQLAAQLLSWPGGSAPVALI
jgi:hypothetical protein